MYNDRINDDDDYHYVHDRLYCPAALIDGSDIAEFAYDALGNRLTYDNNGNLKDINDPNGNTTTQFASDTLGLQRADIRTARKRDDMATAVGVDIGKKWKRKNRFEILC